MNRAKKFLVMVLTLVMVVTMLPVSKTDVYAASKMKLNKKKVTLQVGKKVKLKVKNKTKGAKVTWKSKNKKVATVTKKGKVKAKKAGKTTIIAKVGKKKLKCKIVVKAKSTPDTTQSAPETTAQGGTQTTAPVATTEGSVQQTTAVAQPIQTQAVQTTAAAQPTQTRAVQTTTVAQPTQTQAVQTTAVAQQTQTQAAQTTAVQTTAVQPTQTQAVQTTTSARPTQTVPVTQYTQPGTDYGFDPSTLTYTAVQCEGTAGLALDYSIQSTTVDGLVPWYGDGGNTFMLQFSAASGSVTDVTVNGKAAGDIVTEAVMGLVKLNPNKFDNSTYTIINVKTEQGAFTVVVKKGTGTDTPITTRQNGGGATDPQSNPQTQGQGTTTATADWIEVPASDEQLFYKDATDISVVNVQQPGFASQPGVYAHVSEGIDHITINGITADTSKVAIDGAGAVVYTSALTQAENKVQYFNANNVMLGSVVYKNTNPSASGDVPQPVTAAPTQQVTDAPATTPEQEVPTIVDDGNYITDTTIAKPFGLVVTPNPDEDPGMVAVAWGAGSINSYNVYIDGERRKEKVTAGSYAMPVFTEGTHRIEVSVVVGNRESERISESVYIAGVGEPETEKETYPAGVYEKPMRNDKPNRADRVLLQLNNKTNGKYADNQIYWLVLGYNESNQLCYLSTDGNLVPASVDLNNQAVGDRMVAGDIYHTLEEVSNVYLPGISSGRMYLSYGEPVYITFNQAADGRLGYAGPNVNNPGDTNANTLFEFLEFTTEYKEGEMIYHGNTTRVDFFSFPIITRLIGSDGNYDRCVGDIGTRAEIFAAFENEVPSEFKTLIGEQRIMAPCKTTFGEEGPYAHYYDAYIDEFWQKYSNEVLEFRCDRGKFRGQVVGDHMEFTIVGGDGTVYRVDKPTTQDLLEGRGAFNRGSTPEKTSVELVIEAQLCAAFNRGVATEPKLWNAISSYYENSGHTYNAYAGFFHKHSVDGRAYGFCYDDVNDWSTLLEYNHCDSLVIDLKW